MGMFLRSGSTARWIERLPGAHRGCGTTHRLLLTAGSNPSTSAEISTKICPPPTLPPGSRCAFGNECVWLSIPACVSVDVCSGVCVEPTDVHPDMTEGSVGPPSPDLLLGYCRTAGIHRFQHKTSRSGSAEHPRLHVQESASQHNPPPTGKPTKDQNVLRSSQVEMLKPMDAASSAPYRRLLVLMEPSKHTDCPLSPSKTGV